MKNFTNNFKQFTSRLSARWLIMALMMLVGTSSAWGAKVYFLNNKGWTNILIYYWGGNAGSIGWDDSKSMTSTGDKINGYDVYSYDFGDKAPSNIIFRGKSGDSDKQTVDIGYSANTCWQLGTESGGKYPVSVVTYTPSQSAPVVSTTSAVIDGENLVCKGKVTSMGSASTVVWAFTVLSTDAISKAHNDWKYPNGQNQITTANTDFEYSIPISSLSLTSGTKYYVRSMAVDLNNLGWADNQYGNAVAGNAISFEYDPCTLPTKIEIKGATTPCASKTAVYTAEVTDGSDYELVWSVTGTGYSVKSGEGTTSVTINIGTGTGSVKCTAKCSESSTEESNTINITPYSAKQPELSVYPTTGYICEGEKATISIADPELNVQKLTYQLYNKTTSANVGDAISPTSKPIEFSVQEAGTYSVNVSHTCGGTTSSNKITINYYASPEIPKLILTKPTKCGGTANANGVIAMGNSLPGITYTLKKGNVTCPLDQDGTKWSGLEAGTYTIIASQTACTTPQTVRESVELKAEDITPVVEDLTMPADFSSCDKQLVQGIALQNWKEADGYTYTYQWQSSVNGTSFTNMDGMTSSGMTPLLNGTTWYRVKVTKTGNGCTSPEATSNAVKVTALPVSKPEVSIKSVVYNSATDKFAFSGTLDDAGCATDIEVGYQYILKGNVDWSTPTEAEVSGNEFSAEISIANTIVDQVYQFRAYATNSAGTTYSSIFEVTVSAAENCETSNADYIEILCRRTDNPGSTDADRDMHCYAWDPNTNKTYLGGWPGVKTDDGDFEYKGKKYAVWQIKTNSDIYIIFSNGNDSKKTGDIKGANDAGLKKGYRYVYTLSSDYKTATLYEEPSIIFAPEVKTLSATCARQSDNSLKVTVTGKIMKKGCAEISSYGFQYKKDGDDYTNVDVCSSDCYQDAGFIFTKDITLAAGKYGEYTFRARLINKNSSKVYGEKITIYYSESDVLIAAVGDDTEVTNKSGVYYDFVGLYVKNVMLPEGAKVESYKWYKGDAVYNGGNVTVADRGVSAANNNIRPNEEGAYKCVVTLDNKQTLTSNVINVTATNTYNDKVNASNSNLPVISVRTNVAFPTCATAGTEGKYPSTNIEGWKEKRSVDVKIFNADGTLYYDRKARMNYRGSSSLNFKKKSYAFCPGEENCGQEKDKTPDYVTTTKMNLFGLSDGAKDKDWVLYAAAADPTLMRNRIVFDTYADMTGKWGVDSKYVELVIDGVYQGVYVLMDKITNNEKRVDITDPNGFIVKFDKTDIADREADLLDAGQEVGDEKTFLTKRTGRVGIQTYHTFVDQLFEIEYPEKKKVVKNGGDWSTTLSAIKQ